MQVVWWAPLLILGFVVGAVLLNLGVWHLLLKSCEAVGKRWSASLFISVRQLGGPKSGFLSVIGLLSILGVSFSSCALDSVLSVMSGFQEDLNRKIVGSNAHVVIDREKGEGIADYDQVLAVVRRVDGVVGATPFVIGEALVQSPRTQNLAGVIVRGVDTTSVDSATDLGETLRDGARVEDLEAPMRRFQTPAPATGPKKLPAASSNPNRAPQDAAAADAQPQADEPQPDNVFQDADVADAPPRAEARGPDAGAPADHQPRATGDQPAAARGLFVGAQLADAMNLEVGDEIQLVAPMGDLGPTGPMPKSRPFTIAGIFQSGMYEYDSKYVYIPLADAQRFFGVFDVASQLSVRVPDLDRAVAVAAALRKALPSDLRVLDWQSINKNLFSALKLEKVMMFVMLSLSILVASFSIISTLTLMVFEKHKQIAVLKALGTSDRTVRWIFTLQGALIGAAGAITGSILSASFCLLVRHVIPFPVPKEVFYMSRMPVAMSAAEFVIVGLAAVAVATISTTYPSRIASRLRPADGLRFD
ncbi:MAG: ABC transporter permease [Deltaproteobacteria bacterium]|nr:ABC transporter permease [Deltaproteobacteria bacterium]